MSDQKTPHGCTPENACAACEAFFSGSATGQTSVAPDAKHRVVIDYVNWKGRRAERVLEPTGRMRFGTQVPYHQEPQWLLECFDPEDRLTKWFAFSGIREWKNHVDGEEHDRRVAEDQVLVERLCVHDVKVTEDEHQAIQECLARLDANLPLTDVQRDVMRRNFGITWPLRGQS